MPVSSNPKKQALMRQVELMKMRHRAQPGDPKDKDKSVPLDQKLHVKVHVETKDYEKIFWFRKVQSLTSLWCLNSTSSPDNEYREGFGSFGVPFQCLVGCHGKAAFEELAILLADCFKASSARF